MHLRDLPLVFSPAMKRDSVATSHDPNEIDELERKRGWVVRYLVAYLPWLSLLGYFRDEETEGGKGKRMSDQSQISGHRHEKIDFAKPPRRIERKPVPGEQGDGGATRHEDSA